LQDVLGLVGFSVIVICDLLYKEHFDMVDLNHTSAIRVKFLKHQVDFLVSEVCLFFVLECNDFCEVILNLLSGAEC
jgi:hypothetical protein